MAASLAVQDLSSFGFTELSHDDVVTTNGGGLWSALVKAFSPEVVLVALILDGLFHLSDTVADINEGFDEYFYDN